MNILRRVAARPPNDDSVALIVPLENGARTNAEFLTDLGGY